MPRTNIENPEFSYDAEDPDGFRAGMYRMGPSLGAQRTGTSVYELAPGQAICPYHYEYAEEEWLLVLAACDDPDVPWQRVVHADGSLAIGDRQRRLLEAEQVPFHGARVRMDIARVPAEALDDLTGGER